MHSIPNEKQRIKKKKIHAYTKKYQYFIIEQLTTYFTRARASARSLDFRYLTQSIEYGKFPLALWHSRFSSIIQRPALVRSLAHVRHPIFRFDCLCSEVQTDAKWCTWNGPAGLHYAKAKITNKNRLLQKKLCAHTILADLHTHTQWCSDTYSTHSQNLLQ